MALLNRSRIRQIALVIAGLTFLIIAVLAVFIPRPVAQAYAYTLDSVDSFNEFRAIFIGFWIGLTILLFTAAKRIENTLLGNLGGLMILLQSLGRVLSFVLDGIPSASFIIAFVLEMLISLAILIARPGSCPPNLAD